LHHIIACIPGLSRPAARSITSFACVLYVRKWQMKNRRNAALSLLGNAPLLRNAPFIRNAAFPQINEMMP
jgi:hypothetical protein